jgi:putative ABC transport system permease protein
MQGLLQDVRYAVRVLRATPTFTLIATATLALGIGGTTAMFSIANGVLLQPLPYPQSDRLVLVWEFDRLRDSPREGLSGPDFADVVARQHVFEGLTAFQSSQQTLTQPGSEPERVTVSRVTHTFFEVFGRAPARGRTFTAEEDQPGGARVALLNAGFWQRRFASSPNAIGQTLIIDGQDFSVIGLFADPLPMPSRTTDVWTPLQLNPAPSTRGRHGLGAAARLRPGVTLERARTDLTTIAGQLEREFPDDNKGRGLATNTMQAEMTRPVRLPLLVLLGAVGAVLLITCANVASLLLSRAVARLREVSIRSALGAGAWRIVRQFTIEGVSLSLVAGVLGVAVADVALAGLLATAPINLPRADEVAIDGRALLFVLGVTLVTGLVFGLVPALQTLGEDLQGWLKENVRGASAGRTSNQLRRLLVIGEIAVSAVLLVGAALLIKSFWRLQLVDPGFNAEHVLKVEFQLPASRYPQSFGNFPDWPQVKTFNARILERVRELTGVRSAALAYSHPLDSGFTSRYTIAGRPPVPDGEQDEIRIRSVSPGYFSTVGIPLVRGRWLDHRDRDGQPLVVLINQSAARRHFGGQEPIGQIISFFGRSHTIVGVVGDERFMGLDQEAPPAVYPSLEQLPMTGLSLLVRSEGDPSALVSAIRAEFRALDPGLALYDVMPLASAVRESIAQPQFSSVLVGAFAGMAWLLAILGVHGVLSYSVAQRAQEIGVRMALGAAPHDVRRLVMREGLLMACVGLALGLTAAVVVSRMIAAMLYAVDPRDLVVFAGVALSLVASALLASYLPARRATRVDPVSALRAE